MALQIRKINHAGGHECVTESDERVPNRDNRATSEGTQHPND